MFFLFKHTARYLIGKVKYRSLLSFSFSVRVELSSEFEGMNKLYPGVKFSGRLGMGSYIGNRSEVFGSVGRYTSIGTDVKVVWGTHPHTYPYVTSCPAFYSLKRQNGTTFTTIQGFDEALIADKANGYPAVIGSDCWIGERAIILGGVEIGDGAIVLAGAIVTKNIPPYAIVGGVPARVLSYRFSKDDIDFLMAVAWWNKGPKWLKNNAHLLNDFDAFRTTLI